MMSSSADSFVDLRSDTVTQPSKPMLEAAVNAKTGDDVMGEDPTVLELEEKVADMFGKEKGLFVPSGTMSNLVSILSHCHGRASEMIVGANSHISLWEGGNAASLGGVHARQLVEDETTAELSLEEIQSAFRLDNDDHFAKTELICLENTHNMMGGTVLGSDYIDQVGKLANSLDIKLHIDGARIFNAATALSVSVKDLCKSAHSVSVCLSKGLGAPLGSVLLGETEFIRLAKRARKRCGGGMRQSGVVAAMGLYAIENNVQLLRYDHHRAKRLASELRRNGFEVARDGHVDTNIIYFALPPNSTVPIEDYCEVVKRDYGVLLTGGYSRGGKLFRAVTHLDLTDNDIDRAAIGMVSATANGI